MISQRGEVYVVQLKKSAASGQSAGSSRFRSWIQAGAALLTNVHLPNFLSGRIYQGDGKAVCVPGLNCYSCPAASGACPIGSFQAVVGSSKFSFSYYITGFLILFGVLLGRFICGFLCPFGWSRICCIEFPGKSCLQKAEAADVFKICGASSDRMFLTCICGQ